MKKIIITTAVFLLFQISTTFGRFDDFCQLSGFGMLPLQSDSFSGYGLTLTYGTFSRTGNISFDWNGSIGSVSVTNVKSFSNDNNFQNSGLYLNSNLELNYSIFNRKELTPYVGIGGGYTIIKFNSGEASFLNLNLNAGLNIPLSKDFEFNLDLRTPLLLWGMETLNKYNFIYCNTHIGFTYKVR